MYIVLGSSKYGKTDQLPGLFYVVTEFFHVYYVPLIPLHSVVMLEGSGEKIYKKIPMAWKSVLVTYLRGLVGVGAFVCTAIFLGIMFNLFQKNKDRQLVDNVWYFLGFAILGWLLVVLSYYGSKPSPVRALELARHLDIPMENIVDHYLDDPRVEELMNQPKEEQPELPGSDVNSPPPA